MSPPPSLLNRNAVRFLHGKPNRQKSTTTNGSAVLAGSAASWSHFFARRTRAFHHFVRQSQLFRGFSIHMTTSCAEASVQSWASHAACEFPLAMRDRNSALQVCTRSGIPCGCCALRHGGVTASEKVAHSGALPITSKHPATTQASNSFLSSGSFKSCSSLTFVSRLTIQRAPCRSMLRVHRRLPEYRHSPPEVCGGHATGRRLAHTTEDVGSCASSR